jgi:hypothetical protein
MSKKAFLVGGVMGLVSGFTLFAGAWYRTVPGQPFVSTTAATNIPFPSDGIPAPSGAGTSSPNGNGAASIYGDVYLAPNSPSGTTATISVQACAVLFTGTQGSCGSPTSQSTASAGYFDISVPKWSGTNNPWDYFWVSLGAPTNGSVRVLGIGVTGY